MRLFFFLATALLSGCSREPAAAPAAEVVVYTSIDQQFAQQLLATFERDSGIRVKPVYDTEAGKTTGLVRRLFQERSAPRCDVWWSSEVFGTIELARAGVLTPYDSPTATDIPSKWKDPEHRWTAVAPRARVLAFRSDRPPFDSPPLTWQALADLPADRIARGAIANPQFGTTRGHVAAQFAFWGNDAATQWLQKLRDGNIQIADGNAHAIRMVESGQADWCLTDSDDVLAGIQRGAPLAATVPFTAADMRGLWIPCSVALIRDGPHSDSAKRLYDFLVSAAAEEALARSDSANVPVRTQLAAALRVAASSRPIPPTSGTPGGPIPPPAFTDRASLFALEPVAADFEKIADALTPSGTRARELLIR